MPIKIEKDFTGAIRKTQALKSAPKAFKRIVTGWAADTVKELKRSAMDMKKSGSGRKTGQLARGVGMEIGKEEEAYKVLVGTGVGGGLTSKYAKIQDEGGTIRPKNKKYLAIPLPGTKGVPANFRPDSFVIKSKTGNLLIVQRKWKKVRGGENSRQTGQLIPLFVLKKEVTLPATRWFSRPMAQRLAYLEAITTPEYVLAEAEKMVTAGPGMRGQMD
jgi:hypothetical protein